MFQILDGKNLKAPKPGKSSLALAATSAQRATSFIAARGRAAPLQARLTRTREP